MWPCSSPLYTLPSNSAPYKHPPESPIPFALISEPASPRIYLNVFLAAPHFNLEIFACMCPSPPSVIALTSLEIRNFWSNFSCTQSSIQFILITFSLFEKIFFKSLPVFYSGCSVATSCPQPTHYLPCLHLWMG